MVKAITDYGVEGCEAVRRTSPAPRNRRRPDRTGRGRIFAGSLRKDDRSPYVFKRSNVDETSVHGTGDERARLVGHFSNVTLE